MATVITRTDAYRSPDSEAASLFARARAVMPGGNTRTTLYQAPYPPYAASGHGQYLTDADGQTRIDFLNNYTSLIHGHADPDMIAAVTAQLSRGTAFAMPTVEEIELLGSYLASHSLEDFCLAMFNLNEFVYLD